MSDFGRHNKPTAADVRLPENASFERKVGILFRVPKAKLDALEASTCKGASRRRKRAAWRQA